MEAVYFGILLLVWYFLSYWISEKYNKEYTIQKQWLFAISMLFSPIVAVLVVYLYQHLKKRS
jgi:succinate dehydrogenase/fumarate reductase cytochrome b subunit